MWNPRCSGDSLVTYSDSQDYQRIHFEDNLLSIMKRAIEIADLVLKVLSCIAIVCAGVWALYTFGVSGATDWQGNISIETQVLPYRGNLRLLVVHVKSKNPRNTTFQLDSGKQDLYQLRVRELTANAKLGTVIHEDEGELVASADLLKQAGGTYEFLPNAEMDDMQTVVLSAGTTVSVTAEMRIHTNTRDIHGAADIDENATSAVVRITP